MNALNRKVISLPKFHSFIVCFEVICLDLLPGSSEITCRPGRYRGWSSQHVVLTSKPNRSRLTPTSNLHDLRRILLEEWDAIPQIRIIRLIRTMRRRYQATIRAFGDKHGIDKLVSPMLSMYLKNSKPGVAFRFLALFTIDPHPVLRLLAGGYNNARVTLSRNGCAMATRNEYLFYV